MATTRLAGIDGILDWYWLGVVAGLGVAAGAAPRAPEPRSMLLAGAVTIAAVAVLVTTLPLWTAFVFAGASVLAALSLRRLTPRAVLAAVLGAALLAFIPAVGYVEALAAPVLGWRLRRRAGARYAGLRVLARD